MTDAELAEIERLWIDRDHDVLAALKDTRDGWDSPEDAPDGDAMVAGVHKLLAEVKRLRAEVARVELCLETDTFEVHVPADDCNDMQDAVLTRDVWDALRGES